MAGSPRCRLHGGSAPQVKAKAHVRLAEQQAMAVLHRESIPPLTDPISALQTLAGETWALKDILADRVAELRSWRYESKQGQEQLRSEILLLERAFDRCGRLLTDMAKLGLDERLVRVTEAQGEMLAQAVMAAMVTCGLSDRLDLRAAIADELRHSAALESLPSGRPR